MPQETRSYSKNIYKSSLSAVYGLGSIGALFYYLSHATSFWVGAFGIIKAILWPAFLIYRVMQVLHM